MKRIFAIMATAASLVAMASCEKYEDGRPAKGTVSEFEKMYPDAWDVEWELEYGLEGKYWEVSFETGKRPDGVEHSAKFDMDGNWLETETDVFWNAVPQAVKDALAAEYAGSVLEDHTVDYVETPAGNFYRIDIYHNGVEVKVKVTEEGKVSLVGSMKIG